MIKNRIMKSTLNVLINAQTRVQMIVAYRVQK